MPWTFTRAGCSGRRSCPASASLRQPVPPARRQRRRHQLRLDSATAFTSLTANRLSGSTRPPAESSAEFRCRCLAGAKESPTSDFIDRGRRLTSSPARTTLKPEVRSKPGSGVVEQEPGRPGPADRQVLWTAAGASGFRHNAICHRRRPAVRHRPPVGRPPGEACSAAATRRPPSRAWSPSTCSTGSEVWSQHRRGLRHLAELLGQARRAGRVGPRQARDSCPTSPRGCAPTRPRDGKVLWYRKDYLGPAMIHGDTILQATRAPATC